MTIPTSFAAALSDELKTELDYLTLRKATPYLIRLSYEDFNSTATDEFILTQNNTLHFRHVEVRFSNSLKSGEFLVKSK